MEAYTGEALEACCAHLRVSWRVEPVDAEQPSGLQRGWWECDYDCGMRFLPFTLPQTVEEAQRNLDFLKHVGQ